MRCAVIQRVAGAQEIGDRRADVAEELLANLASESLLRVGR